MPKISPETICTTAGRHHEGYMGAVNAPVYRTSTLVYPDFHALENGLTMFGHWTDYTRNGGPNSFLLQNALCEIQPGACGALPTPSGLSAISTTLLALLNPGEHVLVTDSVYGPVRKLFETIIRSKGVEVTYYDPLLAEGIEDLVEDTTRLIYMEQPGSLSFEVQDVPAIVRVAKAHGIVTVIDSTWASPFFLNPFDYGVDIVLQSLSKYVAGHADVMMGSITFSDKELEKKIEPVYRSLGVCVSPDDIYLVLRGIRTMSVRMARQMETSVAFAQWLQTLPAVERVLFPALETDPGYTLWKRDFKGAPSLFSIILKPCAQEKLVEMMNSFRLFVMGQSWGGFESIIYPILGEIERKIRPWQASGYLLRIHIGLEDLQDLKQDFQQAIQKLGIYFS